MQLNQNNSFVYEERNENFPQYPSPQRDSSSAMRKKVVKQQNLQIEQQGYMNYKTSVNRNLPVHSGTVLNYSQIYNDLIIDKSVNIDQQKIKPIQRIQKKTQKPTQKQPQKNQKQEVQVSKSPFHFQSALQLGNKNIIANKKSLPGIIVRTPKQSQLSFQSKQIQPEQSFTRPRVNKQFRISQIKDKNQKKINFQQVSDLSMHAFNQNASQFQLDSANNQASVSGKNTQRTYIKQKPLNNDGKEPKISEQKVLGNSRSIGVGNHRINKKDLQENGQNNSEINTPRVTGGATPKSQSIKNSPRYNQQKYQEIQQIYQSKEDDKKGEKIKQKVQKIENVKRQQNQIQEQIKISRYVQHNPQKLQIKTQRISKMQQNYEKKYKQQKIQTNNIDTKSYPSAYQNKSDHSVNQLKNSIIKGQNKIDRSKDEGRTFNSLTQNEKTIKQNKMEDKKHKFVNEKPGTIIHFQQKQQSMKKSTQQQKPQPSIKQPSQKQTIHKSFLNENKSVYKIKIQQSRLEKSGLKKNQHQVNSIQVSRVASTIKPTKQQIHEQNQVDLNINFQPGIDQTDNVLVDLNIKQNLQPKQEQPQLLLEKSDYITSFNLQQYTKVYEVLKSIQNSLKSSIINVQQLLKSIKTYLELIATGGLDNIQQFDLPLHKKKILKTSLFYQRVALIILAFCYTNHSLKDSLKYLLNIMGYSINNCLILVKILQETQIQEQSKKEKYINPTNLVIQKSDRLAMKRSLDTLRNNNNVLLDSIQKLSKGEQGFYQNLNQIIKLISKSSLQQTFYSLLEYFSFYLCVSELDHMIPFLAVAPNPYLSPIITSGKYTLVVDIVEIFCYGTKKSKTNIFRPYTQHFLSQMSQYFEIISFVPMFPNQVDKIIDMLDPKGIITHRLYKHHTINSNKQSLKCIDRIGRNMNEMILLDNQSIGGVGSFENCIHVPLWKGNKNDTVLAQLCPLLAMIALKKLSAVQACKKVREQTIRNKKQGVKYINFGITLD